MTPKTTLAALLLLAAGCDPQFPQASGAVRLGSTVASPLSRCLHVRLFESAGSGFGNATASLEVAEVTTAAFPFSYQTEGGLGVSNTLDLKAVAWLSSSCAPSSEPTKGELYGMTSYAATHCGMICGAGKQCACGENTGIDIEINEVAP